MNGERLTQAEQQRRAELHGKLMDLSVRESRARARGEHERAAALGAEYDRLQPDYAALLDKADGIEPKQERML